MKTSTLILAAATCALPLSAQIASGYKVMANVPFTFLQQDKVMPAGRYEVTKVGPNSVILANRQAKVSAASVFTARIGTPSVKGYLSFRCYGESNACFLREIAAPGGTTIATIPMGKAEKEHATRRTVARITRVDQEVAAE